MFSILDANVFRHGGWGQARAGSKAGVLESVTEAESIFVRFYFSSHYILFLIGNCWYRGMVSVIYPAIC